MENVYFINEDGESFCIRATTMNKAINICEQSYLEDMKEDKKDQYDEKMEKEYYHEQVLQSCSLVGSLKN